MEEKPRYKLRARDFVPFKGMFSYTKRVGDAEFNGEISVASMIARQTILASYNAVLGIAVLGGLYIGLEKLVNQIPR